MLISVSAVMPKQIQKFDSLHTSEQLGEQFDLFPAQSLDQVKASIIERFCEGRISKAAVTRVFETLPELRSA